MKLARIAETWPEDSFHPHSEIAELIGVPARCPAYYSTVTQARKILTKKRIQWVCINDAGYRVATPDEHIHIVYDHIQGAKRKLTGAVEISEAAPVERMSPDVKQRHIRQNDRLRQHAAMTQTAVRELGSITDSRIKYTR